MTTEKRSYSYPRGALPWLLFFSSSFAESELVCRGGSGDAAGGGGGGGGGGGEGACAALGWGGGDNSSNNPYFKTNKGGTINEIQPKNTSSPFYSPQRL